MAVEVKACSRVLLMGALWLHGRADGEWAMGTEACAGDQWMVSVMCASGDKGMRPACPQRQVVDIRSEQAASLLHRVPADAGRVKHVPCAVTTSEGMRGSALCLVLEVLSASNHRGVAEGWLHAGEGAQKPAIPYTDRRHPCRRCEMVADLLGRLEPLVQPNLVHIAAEHAVMLVPGGLVDTGKELHIQVCLRSCLSTYELLNSFDLCGCMVVLTANGQFVAHNQWVEICNAGARCMMLGCIWGRVHGMLTVARLLTAAPLVAWWWPATVKVWQTAVRRPCVHGAAGVGLAGAEGGHISTLMQLCSKDKVSTCTLIVRVLAPCCGN
ncbi:hypothetical protein VOLCADRAFT_98143 [Volvox carteri f. nagariensis]|uniref:Uncharacterized protein n=1 Tax=Volvox carteri f. nagariensis TaxID=3068 RepID=D8UEJ9_VOLCA|nr:uncharacterized protein VOLCADRAFT_98143 [Volvox carteri f. nagariensis]EFJ41896.1 hypothetical protein VOLCADRAFT_98143 [Volvox carteri f. nagariensis]|eukprot:XP_002957094.1 hypothetical protein VOLCADRAFT_98143 [Volvox carteri f. nagariensis]